jgi:hypothetical protein
MRMTIGGVMATSKRPIYIRCPGVPVIGHSCNSKLTSAIRCRNCQRVYDNYQAYLYTMKKSKIDRWCLKCGKKFIANNRFLRLCKNCRDTNRSAENSGYDASMYTILVGRR